MRNVVLIVCVLAVVLATEVRLSAATASPERRYLVTFEKKGKAAAKAAIHARLGGTVKEELNLVDAALVVLPPTASPRALERIPGVKRVVNDEIIIQFGAVDEHLTWGVDRIDAEMVWDADGNLGIDGPEVITGAGVKVGVLDTGIADFPSPEDPSLGHPDLDIAGGVNTVGEENPVNYDDKHRHGTMIAGIVAALDNNEGIIGIAPEASLYAVRFRETLYMIPQLGSLTDLCQGMEWCINEGMHVINMSFSVWSVKYDAEGNPQKDHPLNDPAFYSVIQQAYQEGIVLVAAATNDGVTVDNWTGGPELISHRFPASYPEVIAVSATGMRKTGPPSRRDYLASWSNRGPVIDLAAPGDSIESTTMGGVYDTGGGTSYACPHVVGVAALVMDQFERANSRYPCPYWVKTRLKLTAEWLGNLTADEQGAGLVDAENAVYPGVYDVNAIAVTGISAPPWVIQGDQVSVTVHVSNGGTHPESFVVTLTDDEGFKQTHPIPSLPPGDSTFVLPFSWDTADVSIANHTLTATAGPVSGETDVDDNSRSTVVSVEIPTTDIAITEVGAPSPVVQGDSVNVNVTVENIGNQDVGTDIIVTLTDSEIGTIGTETITGGLAAHTSHLPLTFVWDTTSASLGDHTLTASHNVNDSGPANNWKNTIVTVNSESTNVMHVASIAMSWKESGLNVNAVATVTIVDASDAPVPTAIVNGEWSDATSDIDSGVTDTAGGVSLHSDKVKNPPSGTVFTFTVTGVSKDGWDYDDSGVTPGTIIWQAAPAKTYTTASELAFPNPGNPEIWIPFMLARTEHVVIRIYSASGRLVRTLKLGEKAPGAYLSKEKAAHWDGKNEAGEYVSSGLYFYTIQAGDFTATKKMLIAR